jgi:hypothetical protein
MGAILGVAGVVIVVALIALMWMTGATRPKSMDRPGERAGQGAAAGSQPHSRVSGID